MKKFFFILLLLLHLYPTFSQRKADVIVPFESNIESLLVNPFTGDVIVRDKQTLYSYNPDSNKILWKVSEKDVFDGGVARTITNISNAIENVDVLNILDKKKAEINFISSSPFIKLSFDYADVIINSSDGTIVFNSSKEDFRIVESQFIPKEQAFLFMVINNKMYSCVYYDLKSGTKQWITEFSPVDSFFKSLSSFFKTNMSHDKVLTTDNFIYASINSDLYKLDKQSGKIMWHNDFKISQFFLLNNDQNILTMRNAGNLLSSKYALNLLDATTGEKLWKDDISTKYFTYLEDAGDKILIAHANGFNFYNYSDGKKYWKKDAKGDKIKKVIPVEEGYLYVADKEMNLIDSEGKNKWKKTIEICDNNEDEVYFLGKIDNNSVFYLTDSYGNMVDFVTGIKIWKKDVKFDKDKPLLYSYDETKNVFLVYNNKKIFTFDPASKAEKHEPIAKLKEVKSDHTMSDIQLFDWGISLVSQGDVIGVSFDGNVLYHNRYKEPGGNKRGWLKGANALWSFSQTGQASFRTDGGGGFGISVNGNKDENGNADFSNISNSQIETATQRFNALKFNDEYAYVINKAEGGGSELVKVLKLDGEEIDRVSIEGTSPLYQVDDYNDNLYYAKGSELWIYEKK